MKRLMNVLAAVFAASLLVGMASPAEAADAAALWKKDCAKCHGEDGKGDTKMGKKLKLKPMSDPAVQKDSDEAMAKDIKEGKGEKDEDGETPMPAYPKLSPDEVKALVAHIRTFKK